MGDKLSDLPTSNDEPTINDNNIMHDLFGNAVPGQLNSYMYLLIPALIFILINLPLMETLLINNFTKSPLFLLMIKTTLFVIVLMVVHSMGY